MGEWRSPIPLWFQMAIFSGSPSSLTVIKANPLVSSRDSDLIPLVPTPQLKMANLCHEISFLPWAALFSATAISRQIWVKAIRPDHFCQWFCHNFDRFSLWVNWSSSPQFRSLVTRQSFREASCYDFCKAINDELAHIYVYKCKGQLMVDWFGMKKYFWRVGRNRFFWGGK